jgi:hypothetical protein
MAEEEGVICFNNPPRYQYLTERLKSVGTKAGTVQITSTFVIPYECEYTKLE